MTALHRLSPCTLKHHLPRPRDEASVIRPAAQQFVTRVIQSWILNYPSFSREKVWRIRNASPDLRSSTHRHASHPALP